jgi:hypothetical protein
MAKGRVVFVLWLSLIAACATPEAKTLRLQLRNWSGPQPRIGLTVVSKIPNEDFSEQWSQECRESLGPAQYIVDPTSPVQVVLEVLEDAHAEAAPGRQVSDDKVVVRRVTSARRGVVGEEHVRGAFSELCPASAQMALNALLAEPPATSATMPPPAVAGPGCTKDTDCKGDRICVQGQCTSSR